MFQHTAARRRLDERGQCGVGKYAVSTHSRPKAAGRNSGQPTASIVSFNTQPPEGGWAEVLRSIGGVTVSTHSRPKAAGCGLRS